MIFGDTPLDQANGALLAHSRRAGRTMLKKGTLLDDAAIAALREAGVRSVVAARLEPGDLLENDSADGVSRRLLSANLRANPAHTGRVNLVAEQAGLLLVDRAGIDRINEVGESLTIACLQDASVVAEGDMVATIKVNPFAVPRAVQDAVETAAGPEIFGLHPFRPMRVGLVLSEIGTLKQSIVDSTVEVTRERVANFGSVLLAPLRCPHDTDAIAAALAQLRVAGAELLLISAASATVDRHDVGPAAIVQAGGEVVHFGMPVDPGNLICMGRIGEMHAIVLPGCARSPKLNGIDFVLARIFAGLPVGRAEISRMGVGGLLKDVEARPLPRARATSQRRVTAIVLAAGASRRMGDRHKLLIQGADGRAMVARTVDNLIAAGLSSIVVVTGHREDEVRAALPGRSVRFVHSPNHAQGLAESLKSGIAALPEESSAFLVALGDMPLVEPQTIQRLIAAYDPDEGRSIVVPIHQGELGNPVLWDRAFADEINSLSGDVGARSLLRRHAEAIAEVSVESDSVLRDFDTPESLAALPH
jgi:molybdenum cofactor cytidylyltransferase